MDLDFDRKLELNQWIINARWFYMVAIFLIGILGNSMLNLFSFSYPYLLVVILIAVFVLMNIYLFIKLGNVKKTKSDKSLRLLSLMQIGMELAIFAIIMQLGSDKFLTSVFFFLPIISASIIFGLRGALITALISSVLVNGTVVTEYLLYFLNDIVTKNIFSSVDLIQFRYNTINLIETIVTSNFFFVVALFTGYTTKFLFKRERELVEEAEQYHKVSEYRENELRQLDKTTKLLVKRDLELTTINKVLDKKIKELEQSEKSMFKAFADLKQARLIAEKESNRTASIIANFIDPIIVIDKDGRINLLNPAAKDVFGLLDTHIGTEVSGDNDYSMNNFKQIIKKDYKVKRDKELKSANPGEEEVEINYGDEELTYKVITAKVTDKRGDHLGIMKIFYNITREKMIDKLKSDFISIAAHQLRTPLSAIKWVIKMVLDEDTGKLNEEQKDALTKGYLSNERIINLVNDMLNVSRIEEGRFGYSFSKCDFMDVLDQVKDSLENRLEEKHIKVAIDVPKKLPPVFMDRQKMTLVLQNLFENAVKYTPDYGKIKVAMTAGKNFVTFSLKDNGVGIPESDKAKIFSKFFRATNVMRMQTEGSGLGLFIVKNIIEKHGGDITFNSEEGKGTEFVVTLPIKQLAKV